MTTKQCADLRALQHVIRNSFPAPYNFTCGWLCILRIRLYLLIDQPTSRSWFPSIFSPLHKLVLQFPLLGLVSFFLPLHNKLNSSISIFGSPRFVCSVLANTILRQPIRNKEQSTKEYLLACHIKRATRPTHCIKTKRERGKSITPCMYVLLCT